MNITFLIGNGFDLNLGLKTTYNNFIEEYKKEKSSDGEIIKKFKQLINMSQKDWGNAERAFGKYTTSIGEIFSVPEYCICHEDFCNSLATYLIQEDEKFYIPEEETEIINIFSNDLINFLNGFRMAQKTSITNTLNLYNSQYLFNFISFNYTSTLDRLVSTMNAKNFSTQRSVNGRTYRNSLDRFIHVHGDVHSDMVLGVNDETQIENLEEFQKENPIYLSQLIKSKTNEQNEQYKDRDAYEILKSSHLIYIYGMSIGETDKLWWQRICDLMTQNGNLRVIIHCYDAPQRTLIGTSYKLYEETTIKHFLSYDDLSEEQIVQLMPRIHIDGSNIFKDLKERFEVIQSEGKIQKAG